MRRDQAGIAVTEAAALAACIGVLAGAPAAVLIVPGLALLAAPGYVWAEVFFPGRLGGLPRAAVAAGLALAVPVLGGVALRAAGIPLHRAAWAFLLATVTVAGDIVLLVRRRAGRAGAPAQPEPARPERAGQAASGQPGRGWQAWPVAGFAAAALIAAGAVGLAAAGAAVQPYQGFTQLWLVPGQGTAARDILGVSNHEGATQRYRLVVRRPGHARATWNLVLTDGQTWRARIRSAPASASLYRLPDLRHPYRQVTSTGRGTGT